MLNLVEVNEAHSNFTIDERKLFDLQISDELQSWSRVKDEFDVSRIIKDPGWDVVKSWRVVLSVDDSALVRGVTRTCEDILAWLNADIER
jgi:hypothetical protein